jgi:hypothetical protein
LFGKLSRRALDKQLVFNTDIELFPVFPMDLGFQEFFLRIGFQNKVSILRAWIRFKQVLDGFSELDRVSLQDRFSFSGL